MDSVTAGARSYALKYGPLVMAMKVYRYVVRLMNDPKTMYHKRYGIKTARETCDCILFCKSNLLELSASDDKFTVVKDPMCATWLISKKPRLGLHPRPISTFSLPTCSLARYGGVFFLRFVNEPGPAIYL